MLSVSALIHGTVTVHDVRRHGRGTRGVPAPLLHFTAAHPPVVVWNVTQRCNLHCVHCYASSQNRPYPGELTTAEGLALLADLAGFGVPVVLFSGGEPLIRPDLFVLMRRARELGMRTVLSTNGTLIGAAEAEALRAVGVSYVGVSVDGLERTHDRVRGARGAFQAALAGIKACQAAGLRVGLRVTVHRGNVAEVPELLRLMEEERIDRLCLYHLAYAGRGARIAPHDLAPEETRTLLQKLFGWVASWPKDDPREVLTVDNHADGPFLYLWLRRHRPERAAEVAELLSRNGGNQSGVRIACVSPRGDVHPDQFSWHQVFGNVRSRPFSAIWSDETHPLMAFYRHRRGRIGGRCRSCRFFDWCNGNLRVRAEVAGGDLTGEDPACYLTPEETAAGPGTSSTSPD
jgi:radical SAM protein with 4Fe4S-binding SPASM domain